MELQGRQVPYVLPEIVFLRPRRALLRMPELAYGVPHLPGPSVNET